MSAELARSSLLAKEAPGMSSFLTLPKSDPRVQDHLLGTFSATHFASPVGPFEASNLEKETITFAILARPKVGGLTKLRAIALLSKWNRLPWLWIPILLIFPVSNVGQVSAIAVILASLCVTFFHLGISLRNQVEDHLRGFDHFISNPSSRPFREGWVTPHSASRWSRIFLLVALISGFGTLVAEPGIWPVALVAAALLLLYLLRQNFDLKYTFGSDRIQFFILGPLYFWGLHLLFLREFHWLAFGQSVMWSFLYLQYFYLRSLPHLLEAQKFGFQTLPARWGFDKSKSFVEIWIVLTSILLLLFGLLAMPLLIWPIGLAASFLFLIYSYRQLKLMDSPLSSSLRRLNRVNEYYLTFQLTLFAVSSVWRIL